jgi:hypothetical protein
MLTAIDRLLARLERVHSGQGGRYRARCPVCNARRPSLSLRDGGDRALVHCFHDCSFEEICRALGLTIADTYNEPLPRLRGTSARYRAPVPLPPLRDEIPGEITRFRARTGLAETDRLLAHEINEITATIARRHELIIDPLPIPLWDGPFDGFERAHEWPGVFWIALFRTGFARFGTAIDYDPTLRHNPALRYDPHDSRTARMIREIIPATEDLALSIMREQHDRERTISPSVRRVT